MRGKPTRRRKSQYSVDGLKSLLNLDNSEDLFGIEKEIPYQCPRVDSFISDVEAMENHVDRLLTLIDENNENVNKTYIERECKILKEYEESLKVSFEELRTSCDNLRNRGEGWKRLARNMFDYVPNNKRFVDPKFKV
jgi:hypothetical protein